MPKGKTGKKRKNVEKGGSVGRAALQGRRDTYKTLKNADFTNVALDNKRERLHKQAQNIVSEDIKNSNHSNEMKALLLIIVANTQPK